MDELLRKIKTIWKTLTIRSLSAMSLYLVLSIVLLIILNSFTSTDKRIVQG